MQVRFLPRSIETETVGEPAGSARVEPEGPGQLPDYEVMLQPPAPVFAGGNLAGKTIFAEREIGERSRPARPLLDKRFAARGDGTVYAVGNREANGSRW